MEKHEHKRDGRTNTNNSTSTRFMARRPNQRLPHPHLRPLPSGRRPIPPARAPDPTPMTPHPRPHAFPNSLPSKHNPSANAHSRKPRQDKANGKVRELASGSASESGNAIKTASPHDHDGAAKPVTQRRNNRTPTRPYSIYELRHLGKGDLCKAPVGINAIKKVYVPQYASLESEDEPAKISPIYQHHSLADRLWAFSPAFAVPWIPAASGTTENEEAQGGYAATDH